VEKLASTTSGREKQFRININRARELIGLGEAISGITVGTVDAEDMFRAALVQSVASLDAFVHGVVLDLGVEILAGRRQPGSPTQVGLHFGAVGDVISAPSSVDAELRARTHIAERLSKETYQKPDDIAQAFSMVGIRKIWSTAFGVDSHAIKTSLSIAVGRRNQIVHSCDLDPLNPGQVRSLEKADVLAVVEVIENVVSGVVPHCA
jgi:hypothetical protein